VQQLNRTFYYPNPHPSIHPLSVSSVDTNQRKSTDEDMDKILQLFLENIGLFKRLIANTRRDVLSYVKCFELHHCINCMRSAIGVLGLNADA